MPEPVLILVKITLAVVLGGIVGWQREAHDRPAGLRTHILVCVGSAVYTLASMGFGPASDPARVAAQVATGMGFLGAGTIIRHGNVVRGLTTAASLWAVAAIGLCVGLGGKALWVAAIATAVVLLTLSALRRVETRVLTRARLARLTLRLTGGVDRMAEVENLLAAQRVTVELVEVAGSGPGDVQEMQLRVELPSGCDLPTLARALSTLEGLVSLRCE
ncbi:MAG: MgtC/SapB family protein [Armatimonadota bacterium]|nr:MAG: MgtC/SapB family protein [Armatimonadota bacterium]